MPHDYKLQNCINVFPDYYSSILELAVSKLNKLSLNMLAQLMC